MKVLMVQNSIKTRYERWQAVRGIDRHQNPALSFRGSPEDNLYQNVPRGSCVSFATSMSFVNRSPSVPTVNRLDSNFLPLPDTMPMRDDLV
ncbi:hypothetical protein JTE90_001549 [Oedothorax gibbosus]|uniref:Uncharacterized protein n=1 Tax=Oedothorax gibbosus TaxID=931172 RepID=A0AAV6VNL3_9ARAC|nr:hypothetical protein JTE90_001549 [Oedothorax gibbosus]